MLRKTCRRCCINKCADDVLIFCTSGLNKEHGRLQCHGIFLQHVAKAYLRSTHHTGVQVQLAEQKLCFGIETASFDDFQGLDCSSFVATCNIALCNLFSHVRHSLQRQSCAAHGECFFVLLDGAQKVTLLEERIRQHYPMSRAPPRDTPASAASSGKPRQQLRRPRQRFIEQPLNGVCNVRAWRSRCFCPRHRNPIFLTR
mmetsp:Transcript_180/g.573  ORF Transcript_180/g.573 Transcript_180/m.573 type:complete len:200 (-) Transcript_180:140-739(-)